jgi:hypothetical protein
MSTTSAPEKKLKIISLEPQVIVVNQDKSKIESSPSSEDSVIMAPFLINQEDMIEDLGELIDKVYNEFNSACESRNLTWEAELELGMEFGVKFTAKLKISPKK